MTSLPIQETEISNLAWLADVQEVTRPLSASRPIWIRHETINAGPPVPFPERHPYCELAIVLQGGMLHFSQREQVRRQPGDLFLAGPGVPHYSIDHDYPLEWISVYFQPSLLLELSPAVEGQQLLQRVAAVNSPADRYIRPQPELEAQLRQNFLTMANEFRQPAFGSELRMRALLVEILIAIVRSEQEQGRALPTAPRHRNWVLAERALRYLHEHYATNVYARDLAAAAGVSESALPKLFRECLGIPWVQYLQGYRVHRAAAMLLEPGQTVTDAALAVGFEDLSHFTEAFKSIMGVSPSVFAKIRVATLKLPH